MLRKDTAIVLLVVIRFSLLKSLFITTIRYRGLEREFRFAATRSSGPGGQNVNKVNTKAELRFPVVDSALLTEDEKDKILLKLANRINDEGVLVLSSGESRSQLKNKELVVKKFYRLLDIALKEQKHRIPIRLPASLRRKRLEEKRRRAEKKNLRKPPNQE